MSQIQKSVKTKNNMLGKLNSEFENKTQEVKPMFAVLKKALLQTGGCTKHEHFSSNYFSRVADSKDKENKSPNLKEIFKGKKALNYKSCRPRSRN